jgi:hypothetical protein
MTSLQDDLLQPSLTAVSTDPNFYGDGINVEGIVLRIHEPKAGEEIAQTKVIFRHNFDDHAAIIQVKELDDPDGWQYTLDNIEPGDTVRIKLTGPSKSRIDNYYGNFRRYREQSAETQAAWDTRHAARIAPPPLEALPDIQHKIRKLSGEVPEYVLAAFHAEHKRRMAMMPGANTKTYRFCAEFMRDMLTELSLTFPRH